MTQMTDNDIATLNQLTEKYGREQVLAAAKTIEQAATPAAPLSLTCGPTCGCGEATPFTRMRLFDGGFGWESPTHCAHCGRSFGPTFITADNNAAILVAMPHRAERR